MKQFFVLLGTVCVLIWPASNIHAQWVQISGSPSAFNFAISGTNFYAATAEIYLSTNNGTTWTKVTAISPITTVWSLAFKGTNLFAGTSYGVYLTTDNGTTWNPFNTGIPNGSGTINALIANGDNLFAADDGFGVYRSTNNGSNWTIANTGITSNHVLAFAVNGTNLFAGTSTDGVFLSTNSGSSWSTVNTGLPTTNVNALQVMGTDLFVGTSASGVYRTTNNGTNWTSANTGLPSTYIRTFTVSGSNLFTAPNSGGVSLSTDSGTSWKQVNTGLPTYIIFNTLIISGSNLFGGTGGYGIWRRPLSEMITAVKELDILLPSSFSLDQNYPNPFNPSTTIRYSIPHASYVTLKVFNRLGDEVTTLVSKQLPPGSYTATWNAAGSASGIYFYRLQTTDDVSTKKFVLLK
jgi:photosystem II stability/assembly factor-like uncharacterized protein